MDMIPIMDIAPAPSVTPGHNSGPVGENPQGMEQPAVEKFESVLAGNRSGPGQVPSGNSKERQVGSREGSVTGNRENSALSHAAPGKRKNTNVKETHSADLSALMIFLGMLNQVKENAAYVETGANESGALAEVDILFSSLLDDSGYVQEGTVEELLSSIKKLISGNSEGMNPQALQEEFDSLFSALMNSGRNISTKVQDGFGLKAGTGKGIHAAMQDNEGYSGLNIRQWKIAGAEAGNAAQNTESGDAATSGDGMGAPASSLNGRRSNQEISLDFGKNFKKTVATEQVITEQVNAESRARHEASASNAENKDGWDYLDLKSAVNGRAEGSMKADTVLTDIEPHRRGEKGNMLSQAGGDAVKGEERAGTAHITQSGSSSADHDSSGNSHEKSAFIIDFNSANHKSAHRGFSLHTAEGQPVQSSTHNTASSEFAALRTGSVNGNDIKITSLSDSARAGVLDQVGQGISAAMAMNRNRAVIHLNPPELGSVTIRLHVDHNNHVRASFMAEHVHTHQLIESGMESLKSQLAQNGFDLGQVNVNLAGGGMHDPGSSRRHETGTGGRGFENTIKEDDGEAVLDASASGHEISDQGNGVHIIM